MRDISIAEEPAWFSAAWIRIIFFWKIYSTKKMAPFSETGDTHTEMLFGYEAVAD